MSVEPFEVLVNEQVLEDLEARIRNTRWADDFDNSDWEFGTNGEYLKELCDYWIDGFDWRAQEREINQFAHFQTIIDDLPIHFIHEKGKGPNPIPIILTHGWPWTFWDYKKLIGPLTDPASFGADPADSFDVVVPSLPGFGFSTPLTQSGINYDRTADLWVKLMQDELGYEKFAAQGGDWGALTTSALGHKYADRLIGIHLTNTFKLDLFDTVTPWSPGGGNISAITDSDLRQVVADRMRKFASHVAVQVSDPQSLAYAMHDSPVGMCAWLLERRRNWSDCGGNVERSFSKDHLLTTMTIYWATKSFATSVRYYHESGFKSWKPVHDRVPVVEAPTGITFLVPDSGLGPTEEDQKYYNLIHTNTHPTGGHFAPYEEPDAVLQGIRETFRKLR